jgi:hypothetical protein
MIDNDTQETLNAMRKADAIWILKDEHGCMMLTTDDDDGVPVWSSQQDAMAWATEDWAHCEAHAIDIQTWKKKWTQGLTGDDLVIMINPSEFQEHGVVLTPIEFEQAL